MCVFDINFSKTINGEGWRFDILNDAVGLILITVGVFMLSKVYVHPRYLRSMTFIKVIACFSTLDALHDHFIYRGPAILPFISSILSVASLIAMVLFCIAMKWFCIEGKLDRSARSWQITTILFTIIYLVPLGFFYLAAAVAILTNNSFNLNFGAAGLLLLPIFAIPLIHLFVSTSRMKNEAQSRL